ncbi:hypothetical protein JVU11DRAFT_9173 [Chiua virens]|nr:hypothetical protein JVU11DRAFT_9173 [Chiua virens]
MDSFSRITGPGLHKLARNVARDPYAAAKYFFFIIKTFFVTLFGIQAERSRVKNCVGVFGRVSAYFGVVEAQGRGTLHLHCFYLVGEYD